MAGISQNVKAEIVAKVKSGEKVAELSKQYGVSDKTIYNWLRQKVERTVSVLEHNKLKKENSWLKEIVGVLTLELEKSKKKAICLPSSKRSSYISSLPFWLYVPDSPVGVATTTHKSTLHTLFFVRTC